MGGEVREERPPKPEHGRIALRLGYHLMRWLEETGLGVAGVEGGFILRRDPDRVRSPTSGFSPTKGLKRWPGKGPRTLPWRWFLRERRRRRSMGGAGRGGF